MESVEITGLPASVFLLIQAAGRFIVSEREARLCVSFYLHTWLAESETTLQITKVPYWNPPPHILAQTTEWWERATESKASHGHGDISSCGVKTCQQYAYVDHAPKNSPASHVLGRKRAQWDVQAGNKNSLSRCTNTSCNPAKAKEPCSFSLVLIKGLIKSSLQMNAFLISQRAAKANCD